MIVKAPNKILTNPCEILTKDNYRNILNKFIYKSVLHRKEGVGISGNQVGMPYSLFSIYKDNKFWVNMINPEIVQTFGKKITHYEGCLSIPGKEYLTERFTHIEIKYRNDKYNEQNEVLDGLNAIIFQHEHDHISGKLIGVKK